MKLLVIFRDRVVAPNFSETPHLRLKPYTLPNSRF